MPIFSRAASMLHRTAALQNTGSTARDHLASERTFLAWLRTGLGFVALGVAVERFSQFELELAATPTTPGIAQAGRPASQQASDADAARMRAKMRRTETHVAREQVLVAALLGTGAGCVACGGARYMGGMRLLQLGLFRPAGASVGALGLAVVATAGIAWWGMVWEEEVKADMLDDGGGGKEKK